MEQIINEAENLKKPLLTRVIHKIINLKPIKTFFTENRFMVRLFFDCIYNVPDHYQVKSEYELKKFDKTFELLDAILKERKFQWGNEIGCGTGVNTWRIAQRCREVLAFDISSNAIQRARKENPVDNVRYDVFDVVTQRIPGLYDYLFCSETLYYLTPKQLPDAIDNLVSSVGKGGIIHLM